MRVLTPADCSKQMQQPPGRFVAIETENAPDVSTSTQSVHNTDTAARTNPANRSKTVTRPTPVDDVYAQPGSD